MPSPLARLLALHPIESSTPDHVVLSPVHFHRHTSCSPLTRGEPSSASGEALRHLDLTALVPVRFVFQRCLSDHDAARLLHVSRAVATSLLRSYTFQQLQHVFEPATVQQMWRLKALCKAYDVRPTRMSLPGEVMKQVKLKVGSSQSPFPLSLTSLILGAVVRNEDGHIAPRCMLGSDADKADSIQCLWTRPRSALLDERHRDLLMEEWSFPVFTFQAQSSFFNGRLSLDVLPHGLRRLQLDFPLSSVLQVQSIPSTVEVLQLSGKMSAPLSIGQLPSSLVHLVLLYKSSPLLLAGVLPVSLQRLYLCYDHPLEAGVLPPSLQALEMWRFNHSIKPHALPAGLTHLSLQDFNRPLTADNLPPALVSLELGASFQQPLSPHVLPSSLRVFFHSRATPDPLQPGVLPEGLVALH